jgi:hypothetical protein
MRESNKTLFDNLTFFKSLTSKTMLELASRINKNICFPSQAISKRRENSGIMILIEGKIGLCNSIRNSTYNNHVLDEVSLSSKDSPFLISLDFITR